MILSFVQSVRSIAGQLCCSSTVQVLSKITLDLRAGKTTAVVGKSGCGKSTLSTSANLWLIYVDMRFTKKVSVFGSQKNHRKISK